MHAKRFVTTWGRRFRLPTVRIIRTFSGILLTMRISVLLAAVFAILTCSCGSQPAVSEPAKKADAPKPSDESDRFSKVNLVKTQVIERQLLGKPFMPGGTLAHYKKGSKDYEMFVAKLPTATDAAILLLDWNKVLKNSKLVSSFGGYIGEDELQTVFVFAKGGWIAGTVGLSPKEADLEARTLAAHLN